MFWIEFLGVSLEEEGRKEGRKEERKKGRNKKNKRDEKKNQRKMHKNCGMESDAKTRDERCEINDVKYLEYKVAGETERGEIERGGGKGLLCPFRVHVIVFKTQEIQLGRTNGGKREEFGRA